MWYTTPYHSTASVLPTHANHTIIVIFPKASIMRLHKNNTSLKTNTILNHMLRKNLKIIVLLNLKKSTNRRKQILKFIAVKTSEFLRQRRTPEDQVGDTAGMLAQLRIPFPSHNCCTHFLLTSPSGIMWISSGLQFRYMWWFGYLCGGTAWKASERAMSAKDWQCEKGQEGIHHGSDLGEESLTQISKGELRGMSLGAAVLTADNDYSKCVANIGSGIFVTVLCIYHTGSFASPKIL